MIFTLENVLFMQDLQRKVLLFLNMIFALFVHHNHSFFVIQMDHLQQINHVLTDPKYSGSEVCLYHCLSNIDKKNT